MHLCLVLERLIVLLLVHLQLLPQLLVLLGLLQELLLESSDLFRKVTVRLSTAEVGVYVFICPVQVGKVQLIAIIAAVIALVHEIIPFPTFQGNLLVASFASNSS